MVNLLLPRTLLKLSKPAKPLMRPALVTWLKAMRNTNPMGTMMKIAMRITLGKIQI